MSQSRSFAFVSTEEILNQNIIFCFRIRVSFSAETRLRRRPKKKSYFFKHFFVQKKSIAMGRDGARVRAPVVPLPTRIARGRWSTGLWFISRGLAAILYPTKNRNHYFLVIFFCYLKRKKYLLLKRELSHFRFWRVKMLKEKNENKNSCREFSTVAARIYEIIFF